MRSSKLRPLRPVWPSQRIRGLIGILLLFPAALSADSGVALLEISITGIREISGAIAIAIFDSEETFDERTDPIGQARLPIETDSVSWSTEVPASAIYAVIVYQDLNDNGEIDMGRFGRPKEPYGFSNNARGTFGPPGFDEARIYLEPEGLAIEIEID